MSSARRIVFATFGSLGDLHPYVAIARELARRSQTPVIATTDRYRNAVESQGIEFAPMRPTEAQLGLVNEVMERLFDVRRGVEYLVRELIMPHVREAYEDLWRATEGADLLVTHPLALTGPLVAQKRRMPWVSTVLSPLSLLSAIDPPLFAPAPWLGVVRRLGVAPYRTLFSLLKLSTRRWEKPLAALRAELGLSSTGNQALFEGQFSPRLNLALFSRLIAEPQTDWPKNTQVCGFPFYDGAAPDEQTQSELRKFLAQGEAPIVFALGSSAVMIAGRFWEQAIEAASRLKCRAILVTGETPLFGQSRKGAADGARIAAFPYLPYSAVFPHAAVIVHQGGVGTTAQALRAGRPQLVVPVAFDQPDNARRAARVGLARILPFQRANAEALEAGLGDILGNPEYASSALRAARTLAAEDGAGTAAKLIAAQLAHRAGPV